MVLPLVSFLINMTSCEDSGVVQTLASYFMTLWGWLKHFCSVRLILFYGLMSAFKRFPVLRSPCFAHAPGFCKFVENNFITSNISSKERDSSFCLIRYSINHPTGMISPITKKSASIYAEVRRHTFPSYQVPAICISHYLLINQRVL